MNNKNAIFKKTIGEYQKKYRNRSEHLLVITKKQVEEFDKIHKLEKDYLLKGRKWALIDDKYYEIPTPIRWTWFRNLKASTQIITSVLVGGAVSCGAVFPALFATIWKSISVNVNKEVAKYIDIKTEGKIEVGKSCTTELDIKAESKDDVQLPASPENIEVYTGGVKLDYYEKPITYTSSNSINLNTRRNNTVEPENYFTYTREARDKASIFIKKILGPVSINLNIEERSYDVTFDLGSGKEKQVIEVKKNRKVAKPSDPTRELCTFQKWAEEGKDTSFDFDNTLIKKDIVIKAHWEANATGVVIRGINGLAEHYDSMEEAYTAGNNKMKGLNSDLYWGTCTKEKFLETFNDVTLDEDGFYKANLTWELYTKPGETLTLPGGSTRDTFFYSFGRGTNSFFDGDDTKLFLHKTNVVGVTDTKPILKYEASSNNPRIMCANTQHTTNRLDNPFMFKNISFNDYANENYVICQSSSDLNFYLTVDSCDFVHRLVLDGANRNIIVKNCKFKNTKNIGFGFEMWQGGSGEKSENLVFENNIVGGYKRGIHLNTSTLNHASIKNNTFKDTDPDKNENGAIQLSQGTNTTFDIMGNTFDNCKANCFKIHENFTGGATLNIYDNVFIKCGFVGVSLNSKKLGYYTLNSGNNDIDEDTKTDCAGINVDEVTYNLDHVVVLNQKTA